MLLFKVLIYIALNYSFLSVLPKNLPVFPLFPVNSKRVKISTHYTGAAEPLEESTVPVLLVKYGRYKGPFAPKYRKQNLI